jgi:isocitrate/isopropylmalate dehydrogenase
MITIAWLPGDGVGREVTEGPVALLRALVPDEVELTGPWPIGATGFAATGELLPSATLQACQEADAILLGAVGEDRHVGLDVCPRPELSLLGLRRALDLAISVREVVVPGGETVTVVRNLLGGAYVSDDLRQESDGSTPAVDQLVLTPELVADVAEVACDHAEREPDRRFISVDKASVYATSRLWRRVVGEVVARRGLDVDHVYVDRAAYELASTPTLPGVVLTEGLFGDILSDLIAGRAGSPALVGSASLRPRATSGCRGLFEPAHGSAPHRAGDDVIDPAGGFLALAMLLESFPETAGVADAVRRGLQAQLDEGPHTYDLARSHPPVGTAAFRAQVIERVLARRPWEVAGA